MNKKVASFILGYSYEIYFTLFNQKLIKDKLIKLCSYGLSDIEGIEFDENLSSSNKIILNRNKNLYLITDQSKIPYLNNLGYGIKKITHYLSSENSFINNDLDVINDRLKKNNLCFIENLDEETFVEIKDIIFNNKNKIYLVQINPYYYNEEDIIELIKIFKNNKIKLILTFINPHENNNELKEFKDLFNLIKKMYKVNFIKIPINNVINTVYTYYNLSSMNIGNNLLNLINFNSNLCGNDLMLHSTLNKKISSLEVFKEMSNIKINQSQNLLINKILQRTNSEFLKLKEILEKISGIEYKDYKEFYTNLKYKLIPKV